MNRLSNSNIFILSNGRVIYNNRETALVELPLQTVIDIYSLTQCDDGLSNDDEISLLSFFNYAKRNGYPFPAIPSKKLFERYDEENRYYKLEANPTDHVVKRKHRVTDQEKNAIGLIKRIVKDFNLTGPREWDIVEKTWIQDLEKKTDTVVLSYRDRIKDEHGNYVIDQTQQKRQDEVSKLIRHFYEWLSKSIS